MSFGSTHIAHGFTGESLGLQLFKNTKNLSWNLPRLLCEAILFLAFQCNFRHFHKHLQVTLLSGNRWQIGCVGDVKLFRSMKNSVVFLFPKLMMFLAFKRHSDNTKKSIIFFILNWIGLLQYNLEGKFHFTYKIVSTLFTNKAERENLSFFPIIQVRLVIFRQFQFHINCLIVW